MGVVGRFVRTVEAEFRRRSSDLAGRQEEPRAGFGDPRVNIGNG